MKKNPTVVESFIPFEGHGPDWWHTDVPSCNGVVRYRITCEVIEEPAWIVGARLQKLWDTETNPHALVHLRRLAEESGHKLIGEPGRAIKNKNIKYSW